MTTDLEQFHEAFFEESVEAIDSMESGLLNLDLDSIDIESINTIFRGAHSIKGCSATFGFSDISLFVHVMETVLDSMRDGSLTPEQNSVDLLLSALDILRSMISVTRSGNTYDKSQSESIKHQLESILNSGKNKSAGTTASQPTPVHSNKWEIIFRPAMNLYKTGNDPIRMFKVLGELGNVTVEADTSELLDFRLIDPEDCALSWKILLDGNTSKDKIEEVFEWVSDDCDIKINPLESIKDPLPVVKSDSVKADKKGARYNFSDSGSANGNGDATSIRVGTEKVDAIINMVGELVITQSMLGQLGSDISEKYAGIQEFEKLREGLLELERNTRDIQESVMRMRMLPVSYVFNRVPRIVHDLTKKLGKRVDLKISGEHTELDKTVLEKISDPLVHLLRNALDHGIELPAVRREYGKPETGNIYLNACHKGGSIVIEISHDGAGINKTKLLKKAIDRGLVTRIDELSDEQICELIFHPGLSTADTVSDVSGRGVGMDVVRKNIKALSGTIEVKSIEKKGTTFTIRLPLTLAILDGQLVRVDTETYIISLSSIIESQLIKLEKRTIVAGTGEVYRFRDEYIPLLRLKSLFDASAQKDDLEKKLIVVVEAEGKCVGLVIDELLAQQQVVIKSLETNFRSVKGISGATILGDGTVALITDVSGLLELSRSNETVTNEFPNIQEVSREAAA